MPATDPDLDANWTDNLELEFGGCIANDGVTILEDDATAHIGGYTIVNDINARDFIRGEVRIVLGSAKDMDNGNVMGSLPWRAG
ncbi:MAG: fumarylacetoacetate hydrolase family protein [Albidovulum sp.]|nr:fumarylacetoacetate hydrolase family protein [Albidovulum sp.]MDE0303364.1 fumarylacetoacetate hydrolase family protein [Albidovulum sp.]MDE0534238.1 fumarylacetoacetate hydrolase family protein [Albidovulum sp.]